MKQKIKKSKTNNEQKHINKHRPVESIGKKSKLYKHVFVVVLIIIPAVGLAFAINHFNKQATLINRQLSALNEKDQGDVAGAETENKQILDITNEFPIIHNAEISDVSKNKDSILITLESTKDNKEIKTYYEDYFFTNGWQEIEKNTFKKDDKLMTLTITGNVIQLELTKTD